MTLNYALFAILNTENEPKARISPMIIGTRGSDLARTQTNWVKSFLEKQLNMPIEVNIISTQGDRVTDRPLRELEGSGYFTKELEEALLDRRIDVAVHSYKDMPSRCPDGLVLAAVSAREDVADLLIMRRETATESADEFYLRPGAMVGTSAVRRETQLLAHRPDITPRDLRGNVPTRLRKLRDGEYDAIMLACAGVARLGLDLSEFTAIRLNPTEFIPAPCQGALAIQMRGDDERITGVQTAIHNLDAAIATRLERQVQSLFGGGCGLPLGVYAYRIGDAWRLEGFWFSKETGPVRAGVQGTDAAALPQELFEHLSASCHAC